MIDHSKDTLWALIKALDIQGLTWHSSKQELRKALQEECEVDVAALNADIVKLQSLDIEISNRSVLWNLYKKYQFYKEIGYKDKNCKEELKKWLQKYVKIAFRKKEYKYSYGKFNPLRSLKRDLRNKIEETVADVKAFNPLFIEGWNVKPEEKVEEEYEEEEYKYTKINIKAPESIPETDCPEAERHKYTESEFQECVFCEYCGDIKDDNVYIISDAQRAASRLTHSETYDRGEYLIKQLLKMAGKDAQGRDIRMCPRLLRIMVRQLPKHGATTWHDVFDIYKRGCFKKGEWMGFLAKYTPGESLHLSKATSSRVRKLNKALQYENNNFPPGYLVMKCMELAGEEAWKVAFKRSKGVLAGYDKRWKEVCADYEWDYMPSHVYSLKIERKGR